MRGQAWAATSAAMTLAAMLSLAACGLSGGSNGNEATGSNTAVDNNSAEPAAAAGPGVVASMFRRKGPDLLSTVALEGAEPVRDVKANNGRFTIAQVNGVDTLLVDGRPARYQQEGEGIGATPVEVEANSSLTLVGVFEVPEESVAWALIGGGTACAGTHVLVPARNGVALPGQVIPGCDDRGTMRVAGDRIMFNAGGSEGYMQGGLLTIEAPAAADFEGGGVFK